MMFFHILNSAMHKLHYIQSFANKAPFLLQHGVQTLA